MKVSLKARKASIERTGRQVVNAFKIPRPVQLMAGATEPMRQLHDRQPVILDPAVYDDWLDPATPAANAKSLLGRNLDGELQFHRVSRAVNSTKDRADSADMLEPVNPDEHWLG